MTLVEAVISIVVVGALVVGSLQVVGSVHATQRSSATLARARSLAQDLMAEIVTLDFEDPAAPGATLGAEAGESGPDRSLFDDVDDYHLWVESPPEDRQGIRDNTLIGWSRSVVVDWVDSTDPKKVVSGPGNLKRISVTVSRGDDLAITVSALRSSAWPTQRSAIEAPPIKVLMAVDRAGSLSDTDLRARDVLIEFGYIVEIIDDQATTPAFNAAMSRNEVLYLASGVNDGDVADNVLTATIPMVCEEKDLRAELGFESGTSTTSEPSVLVASLSHYITDTLPRGELIIASTSISVAVMRGTKSPDMLAPATAIFSGGGRQAPTLATIDAGQRNYLGTTVLSRRVHLPWDDRGYVAELNENAKTLFKRSFEWAAGRDASP